jgi:hypothetical protein
MLTLTDEMSEDYRRQFRVEPARAWLSQIVLIPINSVLPFHIRIHLLFD